MRQPGQNGGQGLLAVCIREVQKSLKHSAYKLIKSKVNKFGLGQSDGFRVYNDCIQTPGDGLIIFQGMQDHTAESIKSLEGFHRAWIEEAQTISSTSLKLLRPTIREEGSEIWASWNPRFKHDPIDLLLRQNRPSNAIVVKSNWRDNPWFPLVLEQERQDCYRDQPDDYDHIWEGGYVSIAEGAYYAKHIAQARKEKRLGDDDTKLDFYPEPYLPVKIVCDIGGTGAKSDAFVMWALQFVGHKILALDYYEAQGQEVSEHLSWLRKQGFEPGKAEIILPHDGKTHDKVFKVSYEIAFQSAGYKVTTIPNQGKGASSMRIEATRKNFRRVHFDQKCDPGVEALAWYHEKKDEIRQIGLGPDHDWSSHAADAFGLGMCVYKEDGPKKWGKLPGRKRVLA